MLNKEIMDRCREWMTGSVFGEEVKQELTGLTNEEIYDRFYCDLEFGTSGVRGVLGAGTNRMNVYLIRRLSCSLGKVLLASEAKGEDAPSVVVSCDSRRCSDEFALETALVLAAQGIKVYLFDALRPTPELSFAVRHLKAKAGVMITASHNPKEYNGYKVYGEDGAQLAPVYADEMTEVLKECPWDVPVISREEAESKGLLQVIGAEVDEPYLECVMASLLQSQLTAESGSDLKIIYTPLHGAGRMLVQKALKACGFTGVFTVPEQEMPDTEFSTVKSPNPDDAGAWDLATGYAAEAGADIIIASDPDADRLGVKCRKADGEYYQFTGNQIGILLTNYILEALKENGGIPDDGVVIQSMVSTALTGKITADFGVEQRIVPVGFRFIGEQIKDMEISGHGTFLFGFEESMGYLKGTYTRDKDAVLAAVLVAEAALYYKTHGKSLYDVLQEVFAKYGCFMDRQVALKFEGAAGKEKIEELLATLEKDKAEKIASQTVTARYREGKMVCIEMENGGFIKARPSGTEPKVRIYFCIGAAGSEAANEELEQAIKEITELIN